MSHKLFLSNIFVPKNCVDHFPKFWYAFKLSELGRKSKNTAKYTFQQNKRGISLEASPYSQGYLCFSYPESLLATLKAHAVVSTNYVEHLSHRLHGRGFQSKRFHDLETASKSVSKCLHRTDLTVYYGWPFVAKFNNTRIYMQESIKNLYLRSTTNIYSASTQIILVQQEYLFNFNKNIHSASTQIIFVQQEYLFNFSMNIYSTSSRIIFIQEKYSFNSLQVPGHR